MYFEGVQVSLRLINSGSAHEVSPLVATSLECSLGVAEVAE